MKNIEFLRKLACTVVAGIGILAVPVVAGANIIGPFETQYDTDVAMAGVGGVRGTGYGDIGLSGVTGTVTRAYLYWHGPTSSADPAFNADVLLNGVAVTGTNIGFSDDNFWGADNSQAYRADVTGLVSGDGTYSLTGINTLSNGASLIVFYDDGDDTNNLDVVMFDGNDANFDNPYDPVGWAASLTGIDYSSGSASIVFTVSDGQDFGGLDDPEVLLNGLTLIAQGDTFQGVSVPQTAGTTVDNGGLWDILDFDITAWLSPGDNSLFLTTGTSPSDALSLINLAILLPAGSAPPSGDPVPEPASITFLGIGLTAMGIGARRRRRRIQV